ncbi:MAG: hypothetical protein ACR2J5_13830 [Geodermatophilaceae bacterium]
MRTKQPFVAAVAVAALAGAACDADPATESATPDSPSGSVVGEGFDPEREGPAPPIEGAGSGGTVRVLADFAPIWATMDPTEAYSSDTTSILSSLATRSLTQYVYDPEQDAMVLVPDIATDLGTPNADFTQWSFTIRDGVKFEDGRAR